MAFLPIATIGCLFIIATVSAELSITGDFDAQWIASSADDIALARKQFIAGKAGMDFRPPTSINLVPPPPNTPARTAFIHRRAGVPAQEQANVDESETGHGAVADGQPGPPSA